MKAGSETWTTECLEMEHMRIISVSLVEFNGYPWHC